jgi:preprotein translocase subunit SecD
MNGILFRKRFPVLFLFLLLAFAGCQKKAQGPHHFIKLKAQDDISRPQFDTAVMVLDQRLKGTYEGDVTVRAEGMTIILEVAGRPNLDSLAVLVLSKGGFGMYETYNNNEVVLMTAGPPPGSAELIYSMARDTASVRKQFMANNPSLNNVAFVWGPEDAYLHLHPLYALKRSAGGKAVITKDMVNTATFSLDQLGNPSVSIVLKDDYAATWQKVTRDNVGRSIAIRFANHVLSAPRVAAEIPGGKTEISGNFTLMQARMLAAMIATPDLDAALQINHIDTALFVPLRGYPTLKQQARYEAVQSEFLRLRPKIDSLLTGDDMQHQTARYEMDRIYRQDIITIAVETHATQPEVDEFIIRIEEVLNGLKRRLNGEASETDPVNLRQILEASPAQ